MRRVNRNFNSAGASFKRGDICKFEVMDGLNCVSRSIVLILSCSKRYATYLCVSNLETISDNELNVQISKCDLKEVYNGKELFNGQKHVTILVNQIKTNKNSVIQEVYASVTQKVLETINEKLKIYLNIDNESDFSDTEDIDNHSLDIKRVSGKIYLTDEEKLDLIQNYTKFKKKYYSEKYGIPIDKISQKVSSLKLQHKKKREKNGLF